nr:MAG TPA: hypothetical protein [Caudoviricetes sp.]
MRSNNHFIVIALLRLLFWCKNIGAFSAIKR